ncbi:hypothetical protein DFH06DRAFT_1473348 [Mycena polygramma]|nr:hypothetical protein DFH06DRAFT_1473348 [Mycena polygramma]
MHPCLNIPETIDVIFGYLEQSSPAICWDSPTEAVKPELDIAVVARTCKSFTSPALDHLWRSTTLSRFLAQCMPSDLCAVDSNGKMSLLRPIYASDWDRLRLHAPSVKQLIPDPLTSLGRHEIFPALSMSFICLLPNLQTLHWDPHDEVDFQYIHLFLPPTLIKMTADAAFGLQHVHDPLFSSPTTTLATLSPRRVNISKMFLTSRAWRQTNQQQPALPARQNVIWQHITTPYARIFAGART